MQGGTFMKKRSKLFCLLLALVLLICMIPVSAFATETEEPEAAPTKGTVTVKVVVGKKTLYTYEVEVGNKAVKLSNDKYIVRDKKYYEYSHYTVSGKKQTKVTIPAFDTENPTVWNKKWGNTITVVYTTHKHSYQFGYGRIHHWNICACGHTTNEVKHVDPAKDADKVCTCGYAFSNNADLTTLWLSDMVLSPRFNKDVTEYIGEVRTYLDVTSTKITAFSFDQLATIALPENLEIKEGANKFQITVTAEDKATTKTYTVIAVKPVLVEDTYIGTDSTTVSAALKPTIAKKTAAASVSEAVGAKLVELAVQDQAAAISLNPDFSKWGVDQTEVSVTGEFLKTVAEQTQADLKILTPYESTLTIPHAQLASLAEGRTALTFRVCSNGTYEIFCVGDPITATQDITLTVPEA